MAVLFNLPCYPPDSHQSHNAVYWRTGGGTGGGEQMSTKQVQTSNHASEM